MSDSPASFAAYEAPVTAFDVALLDLDGVVYVGPTAVPHAVTALDEVHRRGMHLAYVTNNASRLPHEVAEHLRELGLPAADSEVVTSAQAGARVVASMVAPGSAVLAVGGQGVDWCLRERGLEPVRRIDLDPVAVMQGFGPAITWSELAEASYVLARGVPWVATNMDLTIPTPEGIAPGNGSFVEMLAGVTGRRPDVVAGKPEAALMEESILRTGATRPIIVGDRLDTDIEAGTKAGVPTMLVLTGVTRAADLLAAPTRQRPTMLSVDLRGLLEEHPRVHWDGAAAICAGASARVVEGALQVEGPSTTWQEAAALWRAAACVAWVHECDRSSAIGLLDAAVRGLG